MTDPLALDHLVYAVPDLASAIDEFQSRLGIAPVLAGRHEGLGTHNAILALEGETYVERMALDTLGAELEVSRGTPPGLIARVLGPAGSLDLG